MRYLIAPITILLATLSLGYPIVFKDKGSNMSVDNLNSWRVTKINNSEFKFKGTGNPFTGIWKQQGIKIIAKDIEGAAALNKEQKLELSQAHISGNVEATFMNTTPQGSTSRSTLITASHVHYSGTDHTVTLKGPISIDSRYDEANQKMLIKGSNARLSLFPLTSATSNKLKEGTIEGPVQIHFETLPKKNLTNKNNSALIVNGKSDKMELSANGKKIILTGKVYLESNDSTFPGEIYADKAILTLNDQRELIDLEFFGNPGKSIMQNSTGVTK